MRDTPLSKLLAKLFARLHWQFAAGLSNQIMEYLHRPTHGQDTLGPVILVSGVQWLSVCTLEVHCCQRILPPNNTMMLAMSCCNSLLIVTHIPISAEEWAHSLIIITWHQSLITEVLL